MYSIEFPIDRQAKFVTCSVATMLNLQLPLLSRRTSKDNTSILDFRIKRRVISCNCGNGLAGGLTQALWVLQRIMFPGYNIFHSKAFDHRLNHSKPSQLPFFYGHVQVYFLSLKELLGRNQ